MTEPTSTSATVADITAEAIPELTPEILHVLAGDPADLAAICSAYQPADVAVALDKLPPAVAANILDNLPFDYTVQVFDQPEIAPLRPAIVRQLGPSRGTRLIEAMSADQQADLFRELPAAERTPFLDRLAPATRGTLEFLLHYPPESAGGIMTTEFASVSSTTSVGDAVAYLRRVAETMETVYAIYVTDPATGRLEYVVSLRELLLADPNRLVREAARTTNVVTVDPLTDREEVARLISRYNLLAVPVVNRARRVLGIVTVDDVIDAIVKEQTEDVQKLGGVQALDTAYPQIGFAEMIRKRAGWLCALFIGEMLTATAMGHFEKEIAQAVVLSLFVPLIISSGGNSGSQATSLIIRALALRELKLGDWWRVALRELPSGLVLGAILGVIGIVRILTWQAIGWYDYGPHSLLLAFTVGVALMGVVTFGSFAGSMLPFLLRRLGFDPASASAPFVATLVDVTGLIIYFSVALLMLRGTLL